MRPDRGWRRHQRLAAAYFYRKAAREKARVLVLDNHDDFGGYAKLHEFRVGNTFRLGFGGTFSIESPAPYSAVAKGVIEELGIDVPSYSKHVEPNLYHARGMRPRFFFDNETYGADKRVINPEWCANSGAGVMIDWREDTGIWFRFEMNLRAAPAKYSHRAGNHKQSDEQENAGPLQ